MASRIGQAVGHPSPTVRAGNRDIAIGEAAVTLGIAVDTLRYYERIGLIPRPARDNGGRRFYRESDLSRLRFVKRAQTVGFTLDEIRMLLKFRNNPTKASKRVRTMAAEKLNQITSKRAELNRLHDELTLLTNICSGEGPECPILERLESSNAGHDE